MPKALDDAQRVAQLAVQLDERNPYALWALAMTCSTSRRHDEALSAAEKSIAFNPSFAQGHCALGVVLHYVGRSEEALKYFDRAMALDPFSRTYGCISKLRRSTRWVGIPRLSGC